MKEQELVDDLERASSKPDIAIEAGARGDWPRAEPCLDEAKRDIARILKRVEQINDIDKMMGKGT